MTEYLFFGFSLRSHLVISILYHARSHAGMTQVNVLSIIRDVAKKNYIFFCWKEETRAILCTFMGILEIDRMREFCENKKLNNNKNSSQTRQSKVIKLKSIWPQYIAWRMRNKVENIKEWGSMWWNQRSKFEQWGFEVVQKWNRKDFFKLEFHKNLTDL